MNPFDSLSHCTPTQFVLPCWYVLHCFALLNGTLQSVIAHCWSAVHPSCLATSMLLQVT